MGSTLLVVRLAAGGHEDAHVGDTRLYRLRDGGLDRLTEEHTVHAAYADRGRPHPVDIPDHAQRAMLTRAVCSNPAPEPELRRTATRPGDLYLLSSVGLHDLIDEILIRLTLVEFGANLDDTVRRLVAAAKVNGGQDNITVVQVRQCPIPADEAASHSRSTAFGETEQEPWRN